MSLSKPPENIKNPLAVNLISLMTDFHQKVIYTEANLQLTAASLFNMYDLLEDTRRKRVMSFRGHKSQ